MKIVLEAGSTHMGKKAYALELVKIAEDAGADFIKFQLFPNLPEFINTPYGKNVHLPMQVFESIVGYLRDKRLGLIASAFGQRELDFLVNMKPDYVKFAYRDRGSLSWINGCLERGEKVIVSADCMSDRNLPEHPNLTKLYCIPEYPVRYEVCFDGLFPRFDGFSDHTLGYHQTIRAAEMGAEWIEKHITLEYADVTCPDSFFALNAKEAQEMCRELVKIR